MDQELIDEFISCLKRINHKSKVIVLPNRGEYKKLDVSSSKYSFFVDVNLKGRLGNITLMLRNVNHQDKPLLRLDIAGPAHKNPNGDFEGAGEIIPCPHMHIAHPMYGTSIAYPITHEKVKLYLTKSDLHDLVLILRKFLEFINTGNIGNFEYLWQNQLDV